MDAINTNIDDGSNNLVDPRMYSASIANKDVLHYGEAMAAEDQPEFQKAMKKEVNDLTASDVWELVDISTLPAGVRLIHMIWSFKRKRNPMGVLLKHKASSVLSRTGYVITFSGCPIVWVSKMQTEISLSTTEAEYISLSQSLGDVIPLRTIIKEISPILKIEVNK